MYFLLSIKRKGNLWHTIQGKPEFPKMRCHKRKNSYAWLAQIPREIIARTFPRVGPMRHQKVLKYLKLRVQKAKIQLTELVPFNKRSYIGSLHTRNHTRLHVEKLRSLPSSYVVNWGSSRRGFTKYILLFCHLTITLSTEAQNPPRNVNCMHHQKERTSSKYSLSEWYFFIK